MLLYRGPSCCPLSLQQPRVEFLTGKKDAPLGQVVLGDLSLGDDLLEGLRCLLEVGRRLFEGESLIGRDPWLLWPTQRSHRRADRCSVRFDPLAGSQ